MNLRGFRPTPTNSPFYNTPLRSPTKTNPSKSDEPGLHLRKVIGTTTASSNGFDCRPDTRQFAYTAGAAAVIATVDDDLKIRQQFFRARPNAGATNRGAPWPATPTPGESRNRPLSMVREANASASPIGTVGRDWNDSPTGKSTTAKDRIKAATSVALSPNGKWLAVGESGYKPRVCVFRVEDETSETPVATVAEHTFGVHALAFSPDSRYLASLGTVNDGFLYIWNVDDRTGATTLYAINKCTTSINSMVWMGPSLITVGLRYVKVWKLDDDVDKGTAEFVPSILAPRQKVLGGKNILLGDMLEANFVCVLPLSDTKALVCAESGEICLLDDLERTQTLPVVALVEFRITAIRLDGQNNVHIAGSGGSTRTFHLNELQGAIPKFDRNERRKTSSPTKSSFGNTTAVTAMATFGDVVVELDSKRGIRLTNSAAGASDELEAFAHQLPAHEGAVLGVQALTCRDLPDAAFFTFSGDGTIQIWDSDGAAVAKLCAPVETVPEMYGLPNEIRASAALIDGTLIATGDRYGTVTILDVSASRVLTQIRAHSAEITDINTFMREGVQFIATAGRDRMVQLFSWSDNTLNLVQTMDEHAGAVTGLLSINDGAYLLSCSTDRSVVVRQGMLRNPNDPTSVAFLIIRTIQLKSAPTSICLGAHEHTILVSATDRTISNYNIKNGQPGFTFKCSDAEGGESAVMSKIVFAPSLNGNPTVIGVSSSDKSVRLYTEFGSLVARDWGHTEGITDVALIPPGERRNDSLEPTDGSKLQNSSISTTLVTVAADSTVFMWDTTPAAISTPAPEEPTLDSTPTTIKPLPPMGPPIRKVISHSDLSRYKQRDPSPVRTPQQPPSPQRLRKKSSRASVAQAPKLDTVPATPRPATATSSVADLSRRRQSLRNRSPSPTSSPPRNSVPAKKDFSRRRSVATLRSKSSESCLTSASTSFGNAGSNAANSTNTGFGSLTSSSESVGRTLKAYRRKLAGSMSNSNSGDGGAGAADITLETLKELERELRLTVRVLNEKVASINAVNATSNSSAGASSKEKDKEKDSPPIGLGGIPALPMPRRNATAPSGPVDSMNNTSTPTHTSTTSKPPNPPPITDLPQSLSPHALDPAAMAKYLLEHASDHIVGLLDERIKERVESQVRKTSGNSMHNSQHSQNSQNSASTSGNTNSNAAGSSTPTTTSLSASASGEPSPRTANLNPSKEGIRRESVTRGREGAPKGQVALQVDALTASLAKVGLEGRRG